MTGDRWHMACDTIFSFLFSFFVSVLLSAQVVRFNVSRMRVFKVIIVSMIIFFFSFIYTINLV